MKVLEKIITLSAIFLLIWAWGEHQQTGGLIDRVDRESIIINNEPSEVENENPYILFDLNSIKYVEDGTYQYKFKKYDPEYIENIKEYQYIESHSITDKECFAFKNIQTNKYIFTYEYTECDDYDPDFQLSALIIKWVDGKLSVVTDQVMDFKTQYNEPYYGKLNIILLLDSRLAYSIKYYNRQEEIKEVILYLYTERKGTPAYVKIKIPSYSLERE